MMTSLTAFFAILVKEFKALSRDIHGLAVLFVMPAVFILIMSLALKDAFTPAGGAQISYALIDEDQSVWSAEFAAAFAAQGLSVKPATALENQLRQGELQFGLVLTDGFGDAVESAEAAEKAVVQILIEPTVNGAAEGMFRARLETVLARLRLKAQMTAANQLPDEPEQAQRALDAMMGQGLVESRNVYSASERPTSVQQSVPAWLVFSMFFVVIPLSTIFITEREQGTLARLKTIALSPALQLAGKIVPFLLINQVQAVLMLLVGRFIVPRLGGDALQFGESWLGLWLMVTAVSFAAISFALLVAVAVRTTEQATTVGGLSNILFGALGGVMVPKFVMPAFMHPMTELSPMAWGLEGFLSVFLRGGGAAAIATPALKLLGFGALALLLALMVFKRRSLK